MPNPEQPSNTTAFPADTIPPIVTIYRPTWSDHLLAIGFLAYAAAFTTLAIIIIYRIFS